MQLFRMLKSMWRYLKKDKGKLIIYIITTVLLSFHALIYPFLWGKALSSLINNDFNSFVIYLASWSGIALVIRFILELPNSYCYNKLELNFTNRIIVELFRKYLELPAKAYEEHGVGEYINRITSDSDRILDILKRILKLTSKLLTVIIIIVYAIKLSVILFIELVVFAILVYIITNYFKPKLKKVHQEIKADQDRIIKEGTQYLTGIREVKALGIKRIVNKLVKKDIDNLKKSQLHERGLDLVYNNIIWSMYLVIEFIVLFTCAYLYSNGEIPFESFVMFESYLYRIYDVIQMFSEYSVNYQKVLVSLTRIEEIVDNKLYDDDKFGTHELENINGVIEFKDVHFGYDEKEQILKGLTLKLEPGKKIAVVGKSGQGKTTLFNLLLRFFKPTSGEITIDSIKLEDITEKSLREAIAVIRQDPYIFNRTIKENFELLNENITLEEVRENCRKAYIDDYLMSLPKQYDTLIGEGGVNLSGGQKQRLAIARSLTKNTKIILLDEATSALDNQSQAYIKQTIDDLARDHTVIIIAHRLSTIIDSDEIYIIDGGKLSEVGTHEELLEKSPIYKNLYSGEIIE